MSLPQIGEPNLACRVVFVAIVLSPAVGGCVFAAEKIGAKRAFEIQAGSSESPWRECARGRAGRICRC